jgi:hypothetical protein
MGKNIDQKTLLSTDYFNTFNSVIMLFDMLPEMPELLEEVAQWQFLDYVGHFKASGLDFAQLAIEAYEYTPTETKTLFEHKIKGMRIFVEEASRTLHRLQEAGEMTTFAAYGRMATTLLRGMVEEGNGIIHGRSETLNQESINQMF